MAEFLALYPAACVPICLLLVAAHDLRRLACRFVVWAHAVEMHP